jgi:hypothetical protein
VARRRTSMEEQAVRLIVLGGLLAFVAWAFFVGLRAPSPHN